MLTPPELNGANARGRVHADDLTEFAVFKIRRVQRGYRGVTVDHVLGDLEGGRVSEGDHVHVLPGFAVALQVRGEPLTVGQHVLAGERIRGALAEARVHLVSARLHVAEGVTVFVRELLGQRTFNGQEAGLYFGVSGCGRIGLFFFLLLGVLLGLVGGDHVVGVLLFLFVLLVRVQ